MDCEHVASLEAKFKRHDNNIIRQFKCNECLRTWDDVVTDDAITIAMFDAIAAALRF